MTPDDADGADANAALIEAPPMAVATSSNARAIGGGVPSETSALQSAHEIVESDPMFRIPRAR
jgi:hypothetical protein